MDKKRWISILIPILILLSMTILPLMTIMLGDEIILQTRPVDPRDIFRGDYVILSYEIEEIDLNKVEEDLKMRLTTSSFPYNKDLYVQLKEESGVYVVDKVTQTKPSSTSFYMKAKYIYVSNRRFMESTEEAKLIVSYNIDKYFVPENTGTQLEEAARNGDLMAKVKILNGYALLSDIYPKSN